MRPSAFITALYLLGSLTILSGVLRLMIVAGLMPHDNEIINIRYNQNPILSWSHIAPGMVMLLIGPLQFIQGLRAKRPGFHRWSGRVFLICGLTSATTAIWLVPIFPVFGGALTGSASIIFAVWFLASGTAGLRAIRSRNVAVHRRWMIRAFAVALGVSSVRIWLILFQGTTSLEPELIFGISFWLGFGLNALVAEWILRR